MSFLIRNGTLRRMAEAARTDPSIRKADTPPRALTPDELVDERDALSSSLGGNRASPDERTRAIARYEAAEDYRRQVAKADAERDAGFAAKPFVLPSEERRRVIVAIKADAPVAKGEGDKPASTGHDDLRAAADATATNDPPPRVKPGTSNIVHDPHPEGVHARRDGRTITSTHAINRRVGKADAPGRVALRKVDVDGSPSFDLSQLYVVPRA